MERSRWSDIIKNPAYHPRTETVPLPSGCSLVPQQYTRGKTEFIPNAER
jgi:hypothetical protein